MIPRSIFSVRLPGVRSLVAKPAAPAPSTPSTPSSTAQPDGDARPSDERVPHSPEPHAAEQGQSRPEDASGAPHQRPYRPLSRLPAGGALVPAPLARETERALAAFAASHPDPDAWLMERLGWSHDALSERLTAEQADAVALGIQAAERRQGFVLADTTGFGKGRILWAVAIAILRAGGRVLFLTETENLFSDAWRDIRHLGAEGLVGRPVILNAEARVVDLNDPDAPSPFPVWKASEVKRLLGLGSLPEDVRVVFATYSQFSRAGGPKAEWLLRIAPDVHLLLDEAHNMVGRGSNTSRLFRDVLSRVRSTLFSSATFSRDVGNTAVYANVFTWLSPLLRQGGREIPKEDLPGSVTRCLAQESVCLAASLGRLIRREIDMSGVCLEIKTNEAKLPEREGFADAAAEVFDALSRVAMAARGAADRMNASEAEPSAEGKRRRAGQWNALPLGGVFASLVDQMDMALLVEDAVEDARASLAARIKPVIVVEHTLETFLRDLEEERTGGDDEDANGEEGLFAELGRASADVSFASFGDACRMAARRLATLTRRRAPGAEPERLVLDTRDIRAALDKVETAVERLPPLPLSPVDDIRNRLEAEGWRVREISGRTSRVENGRLVPWQADDRNLAIAGFNHGDVDALIVTRAGATGLSLHDSREFRDRKQRRMIFLRMLRSPVKMVQMMGRVFRRGQVSVPSFVALSTGLPSETYGLAMQRRKLEELSASVTGQARGVAALDVPEPFNALGERLAKELLTDRPDLSRRLGISLEEDDAGEAPRRDETWTVRRLFRRLPSLPVALQKRILDSFFRSYRERLDAGEDPDGKEAALPGVWDTTGEFLVHSGDGSSCPVLGPPVKVLRLSGRRVVTPLRASDVARLIAESNLEPARLRERAELVLGYRQKALLAAAGGDAFALDKALREPGENRVKALDRRIMMLSTLLKTIMPGIGAQLPDEEGRGVEAVVVDLVLAPDARALSARDYRLAYALPGEGRVRRVGLDAIISSQVCLFWDERHGKRVLASFDEAVAAKVSERRLVLCGSLPRAAMEALRAHSSARNRVSWTGSDGERRVGFLLPKDSETAARTMFLGLSDPHLVASLLGQGAKLWSDPRVFEGGLLLSPTSSGIFLLWPEGRRDCAALMDAGLSWVKEDFPSGHVSGRAIERLCRDALVACGSLYADIKWREHVSRRVAENTHHATRTSETGPALSA